MSRRYIVYLNKRTIVVLACLCLYVTCLANNPNILFERIDSESGMDTDLLVEAVTDDWGYLWVSGYSGLYRFDGDNAYHYKSDPKSDCAIPAQTINTVFPLQDGAFLLGTTNGLSYYNPYSKCFSSLSTGAESCRLSSENIYEIESDISGNIWIGTRSGIDVYFPDLDEFKNIVDFDTIGRVRVRDMVAGPDGEMITAVLNGLLITEPNTRHTSFLELTSDKSNTIMDILAIGRGEYLVLARHGIYRFDLKTEKVDPAFSAFFPVDTDFTSIVKLKGDYFFGTKNRGLFQITEIGEVYNFTYRPSDPYSLSSNYITNLFADNDEKLWLTTKSGICLLDFNENAIKLISPAFESNIQRYDKLGRIGLDSRGGIWFSERKNGLFYLSGHGATSQAIRPPEGYDHGIYSQIPFLWGDNRGRLWMSSLSGIFIYDRLRDSWQELKHIPGVKTNRVNAIIHDKQRKDIVWISMNNGLVQYDLNSDSIQIFTADDSQDKLKDNNLINELAMDDSGRIWLTAGGFFNAQMGYFDTHSSTFNFYPYDPKDKVSKPGGRITGMVCNREGDMFAASNYGLVKYDNALDSFLIYSVGDGLQESSLMDVMLDDKEMVWMTAGDKLIRFNPSSESFAHYSMENVVRFNVQGGVSRGDSLLYFIGENGICYLNPNDLDEVKIPSPPVLRSFFINNENHSLPYGKGPVLDIAVDHKDKLLIFEFRNPDGLYSGSNNFAYRFSDDQEDWQFTGEMGNVSIANLKAGSHRLEVKTIDKSGTWSVDSLFLSIDKKAIWWASWWAKFIYSILGISIVSSIYIFYYERNTALREQAQLRELAQYKNQFFTNISHEFRTPLTLIKGPVEQLIKDAKDKKREDELPNLNRIATQSEAMLSLVNQIMELQKLDEGKLQLEEERFDLVSYLNYLMDSFRSASDYRSVSLQFDCEYSLLKVNMDKQKLYHIVSNLLSNALKFSPDNSTVQLILRMDGSDLYIEVVDEGVGIGDAFHEKIFTRFYQEPSTGLSTGGSGVGLSLSRELARFMGGELSVFSRVGEGAKFSLLLQPTVLALEIDDIHLGNDENTFRSSLNSSEKALGINTENLPLALIVEDHKEVGDFIEQILKLDYQVLRANDGIQGGQMAKEFVPEIIVTDLMMPGMDGLEMCQVIKEDILSSHIPIIMLTAKASVEQRIQGLRAGADDYLSKPFNEEELLVRMENLIRNRKALRKKISELGGEELPDLSTEEKIEAKFLGKVNSLILEKSGDGSFSIEGLCQDLQMSRTQLHRKLTGITGLSASKYIHKIRLEKAQEELKNEALNISEIAYSLGYNDPNYFSKVFTKYFGISPTKYRNSQ